MDSSYVQLTPLQITAAALAIVFGWVGLRRARETGGLGLTSADRGVIQGIVTFLLYLFPVVTGAFADKFGFKRTFFLAYLVMTPSYFLLGQARGFWSFFFVFLLVAIGAALFIVSDTLILLGYDLIDLLSIAENWQRVLVDSTYTLAQGLLVYGVVVAQRGIWQEAPEPADT